MRRPALDLLLSQVEPYRMGQWSAAEPGVVQLPSGRRLRGHSLRRSLQGEAADFTLVLTARSPASQHAATTWIRWPDFGLPLDRARALRLFHEAWERSDRDRVTISCRGGRGRTGTALACIAVLDGLAPAAAISLVRRTYDRRAIETPWQKRYVATFAADALEDLTDDSAAQRTRTASCTSAFRIPARETSD